MTQQHAAGPRTCLNQKSVNSVHQWVHKGAFAGDGGSGPDRPCETRSECVILNGPNKVEKPDGTSVSKSKQSVLAAVLVLATFGTLLCFSTVDGPQAALTSRLAADGRLRWYRGNLHTHSLWSDGDDYLESIGLWYKDHGYDFLCFTDHNVLPAAGNHWVSVDHNGSGPKALRKLKSRFPDGWVETRTVDGKTEVRLKTLAEVRPRLEEPGRFLLLQGEEISDWYGRVPLHLNASNVQQLVPPMHGASIAETIQNDVDAVIAQRERMRTPILVHLNHPNYDYAVTAEDLMRVHGDNFFEVYNGHPSVHNSGDQVHASTERIWDILLAHRMADGLPVLYGLANDDGHRYHHIPSRGSEPGRGWIMVLSPRLSADALVTAVEAGRFYASSGVRLRQVTSGPGGLNVEVEPEPGVHYTIDFIGTRTGFDRKSEPVRDSAGKEIRTTRRYSDQIGKVFQSVHGETAQYQFAPGDLYVRARVTSTKKHPNPSEIGEFERAWVQPVPGPAAPKR